MMRRSSLGGRRRASCALDRSRADAIICSTVCRSTRGARTSPVRTGSSNVRPRAARASELTDNLTAFAVSSMAPSTMARVHGRAEGPGIGRLSLCELPVQRLLLDPVPEGFALLPQGRQVIQRRTDRGGIRIRDQLKVDSDELEGLTRGVLQEA